MRQTNPIFLRAKRTASALRKSIYGYLYLQGAWEKQTQFPGGAGWDGAAGAGDEGQMRQTNPISGGATERASALWQRSYGGSDMGGTSAKQSQLRRSLKCEAKPIWPVGPDLGGRNVRIKPNFRERAGARVGCTNKANSLRANWDGRWPAGPEVVRHRGQSCETNPIWPVGRSPEGEICKTNPSRAASPRSPPASDFTLHTSNSAEGRSCETKPITRDRAEAMDVEQTIASPARQSATVCRPHPPPE